MRTLRRPCLAAVLLLAGCARSGVDPAPAPGPDVDAILTLRNVDPAGIAIAWVEVTDAEGVTKRVPEVEGLLTFPGLGEDSELRIHHMPPGTYAIEVQWKSAEGVIQGDGLTHPDPVTFVDPGEDRVLELEYPPER
jgi:hypothetical protein